VPFIWSLPITLMVGELTAALPSEGGYYAWARRALGPFWGVQTAWMALAMSLFDMAIYPMLVVTYLGQLFPALTDSAVGGAGWYAALSMIGLSVWWNLRGTRAVGIASQLMAAALLLPFVILVAIALSGLRSGHDVRRAHAASAHSLAQRRYGHAVDQRDLAVPVELHGLGERLARRHRGRESAANLSARDAVDGAARRGLLCGAGAVRGGQRAADGRVDDGQLGRGWSPAWWTVSGRGDSDRRSAVWAGMFNALVGSYSRLPLAMARDGILPKWLGRKDPQTGAPRRSILFAAVLYTACLGLGFQRLVQIDVMLYGALVVLEFVSLIVLRIREPALLRPFRMPGGIVGAALLGSMPVALLGLSLWYGRHESGMWGLSAVTIGALVIALGPVFYLLSWGLSRSRRSHLRTVTIPPSSPPVTPLLPPVPSTPNFSSLR
jgi:amino acid transporter